MHDDTRAKHGRTPVFAASNKFTPQATQLHFLQLTSLKKHLH